MSVAPAVPVPGPMQGGLPFYAAQPASTVKNYTTKSEGHVRSQRQTTLCTSRPSLQKSSH
eukprot:scaffold161933_cov46-Attheya_sp.AAC.3